MNEYEWDVFISHASEDKDTFVRPLAAALGSVGLRIWYDEQTLVLGDSLRRKIDQGLLRSRHGVVVLSPSFFAKEWPQRELDSLASLEIDGQKVILPIWHNVSFEEVRRFSPTLADRIACPTTRGLEIVVTEIIAAIRAPDRASPKHFSQAAAGPPATRSRKDGGTKKRGHPAPIKVAILKGQLKLLQEIEMFFRQGSAVSARDLFAFDQIVAINGTEMAASYAKRQFGAKLESQMLEIKCTEFHFHPDTPVIPLDHPYTLPVRDEREPIPPWSEYFHWVVSLPPAFSSASERLRAFRGSPMLPASLTAPLEALSRVIGNNVEAVRTAMNECATEMPTAYPTAKSLKTFHTYWIWNRFNKHALDPWVAIGAILDALRQVLSGRTLNQLAAQPDIAADPQTTALRLLVLRAAELGRYRVETSSALLAG